MSPDQVEFTASYDRTTKIISAVTSILLLVVAFAIHQVIAVCVSILIIAVTYAYSPRGYAISEGSIVVRRLIGNVHFPLERVRELRRANADDLHGCLRLWGSGGMFGYYGLFRTSKLGNCWWYVTNRQNAVVLFTGAKAALLSPDHVDGFLAAIRAVTPGSATLAEISGGGPQTHASRFSPAKWIGIGIGFLSVAVVGFAAMYSPGPPSYTLTPDTLTVHDRFYPVTLKAAGVDVAQIRLIDITTDTGWRPVARTNGFANSHYRSGWFRVANGQTIRMYRTDRTRLVLLPPRGNGVPVLLEVAEPDRFVEKVRQTWPAR